MITGIYEFPEEAFGKTGVTGINEIKDWLVEHYKNHPAEFPIPRKEFVDDPDTGEAAPFATRDECFQE